MKYVNTGSFRIKIHHQAMLTTLSRPLAALVEQYLPDPLVIVILLTFLAMFSALLSTPHSPTAILTMWGSGLSNLLSFAMQMLLVLVSGYLLATTPVVSRYLHAVARRLKSPALAVIVTTFVAMLASWINWGFGLVAGALFAKAVAQYCRIDYRVLVASAYSGFIVWHGGLSGSVPLTIATPGHFSESEIGLLPTSDTLFSTLNLSLLLGLSILLPTINYLLLPKPQHSVYVDRTRLQSKDKTVKPPAKGIDHARWPCVVVGLLGLSYLAHFFVQQQGGLNLNVVIALFLFCAFLLHHSTHSLLEHLYEAVRSGSGIVIQFPFYAGLMAIMSDSGLAENISSALMSLANSQTLPLLSFLSAGLVNIFVPSGGGQWALQAPLVIPAAQALEVPIASVAMAVAWGDAWTNLIQPFWAIPVLAIAGLKAKDIMGFCIIQLLITGGYISVILLTVA